MWPFTRRHKLAGGLMVTPEDLQVMSKALTDRPEYVRFWMGMRDQRRKSLDFCPTLKTEAEIFAHGLRCHDIQRDLKLLTSIIEMPLTAKNALEKLKQQNESKDAPKADEQPWDEPQVPEEDI